MFLSAFSDEATVAQVKALGAVAYLVKPLDIGQIVPAVEAVFANLARLPNDATRAAPPEPAAAPSDPLAHGVSIAVGVLMHRFSLDRGAALSRLRRLAADEGHTLEKQSEQLVQSVELMARPAAQT